VSGVLIYTRIISSSTTALANLDTADSERTQTMEAIERFMRQRDIPRALQKSIMEYYDYFYSRDHHLAKGKNDLLQDLHVVLRQQLKYAIHRHIVQQVPMFAQSSSRIQLALIERLESRVYLPGELVIIQGGEGMSMFFIVRGQFQQLNRQYEILSVLSRGEFFGERSLLSDKPIEATVRCVMYGELLELSKEDLAGILAEHPEWTCTLVAHAKAPRAEQQRGGWHRVRKAVKLTRTIRAFGGTTTVRDVFDSMRQQQEAMVKSL
jgi:hypothetical protein